jgi:tetratricopeptide (TPR) repeat protein
VRSQPTPPPPQPVKSQPQAAASAAPAPSFADAERALNAGDLARAGTLYRTIVDSQQLRHAAVLRAAEGLYRSRDFVGAIKAFDRAGAIVKGEEQYHWYYAVALYETGRRREAKRELHAALPYIEMTREVERYAALIDAAAD